MSEKLTFKKIMDILDIMDSCALRCHFCNQVADFTFLYPSGSKGMACNHHLPKHLKKKRNE